MTSQASHLWLAVAAAMVFATVHFASPRLTFLDRTPRSIWLSVAGGVSVAYVFLHLLPELAHLNHEAGELHEAALYIAALVGFVVFYGVERLARAHAPRDDAEQAPGVFWLHLATYASYNLLIGYLLEAQARQEGVRGLTLYALAMALHFVVNDRALFAHHGDRYHLYGRWILAGGVFLGLILGVTLILPTSWVGLGFAVLAGSVVLNVIKEELPAERESRFWAFALGTVAYSGLLVLL